MHVLLLECEESEKDLLIADLWERGAKGFIENDLPGGRFELQAFFAAPIDAARLAGFRARWEKADETNWARIIMDSWAPVSVGERFFIVPDWKDDPTPPGRLRLEVHPGLALGTGYHATTQMCMEAMERRLRPDDTFFDLGCGTGVLCQAAWLLGARRIVACDTDEQAMESAAENFARARIAGLLYRGSIDAFASLSVDFLVANISADGLLAMADDLRRVLKPGATAVLSGFPPFTSAAVGEGFAASGFEVLSAQSRDEWACLVARKTA